MKYLDPQSFLTRFNYLTLKAQCGKFWIYLSLRFHLCEISGDANLQLLVRLWFPWKRFVAFVMTSVLPNAQCENFSIFLSLKFYVKSILENAKVQKIPFCRFRGSELCYLLNFSLQKVQIFLKIKFQCLWMC